MTGIYYAPRLNKRGSLHALTLTHERGLNADVGGLQAAHGNPIYATS